MKPSTATIRQIGPALPGRIAFRCSPAGIFVLASVVVGIAPLPAAASARRCAQDAVAAGAACIDRYEESVWRVPDAAGVNANLVRRIRQGRASRASLIAAGATPLGRSGDDYAPCGDDGQNCADDIFAVSLPSEIPAANITWFQAEEACANSSKRLPTSAEWQIAASGTPDPGPDDGEADCNSASRADVTRTGSRSQCVSARGAFDMAGNLFEWVADWLPLSTTCPGWGALSNDVMCVAGASTTGLGPGAPLPGPGAMLRGGSYLSGTTAGPLTAIATVSPSRSDQSVGFRCALGELH